MKSTIDTTSDLRDISKLAIAVSQSTIGALYLVNSLENREKEKLEKWVLMEAVEETDENKKINEILENLTQKIELDIDSETLDEITSEKNEDAYFELRQRAANGDDKAKIALSFIRKSANLINNNKAGRLNADTKDLAALVLVGKITELGEDIVLLSATQLIREFGLDKYDIYDLDENGNTYISADKIKSELQKEFDKKGMNKQAQLILGLDRERANLGLIEELNNVAEASGEITLLDVHMNAKKKAELATFRHNFDQIINYRKKGEIEEDNVYVKNLVENNQEIARKYLKDTIEFYEKYSIKDKNFDLYSRIGEISMTLQEISLNDKSNNYRTEYNEDVNNSVKLEELIAKGKQKYNNFFDDNKIRPSNDDAR